MIAAAALARAELAMSTRLRFIAKFDYEGEHACWPWTASRTEQGYGRFAVPGRGAMTAHRVAYVLFNGHVAEGLTIDHLCGNPWCVNPAHLEAVPHEENLRRAKSGACAANSAKRHCPHGHEYSLYTHPKSGRTQRVCLTCRRVQKRDWQRARRARSRA